MVEISGKVMLARPEYQQTIELKKRIAEASHRHLVVLTDDTEIRSFIKTLEAVFL